jgi:hypothetical protein
MLKISDPARLAERLSDHMGGQLSLDVPLIFQRLLRAESEEKGSVGRYQ